MSQAQEFDGRLITKAELQAHGGREFKPNRWEFPDGSRGRDMVQTLKGGWEPIRPELVSQLNRLPPGRYVMTFKSEIAPQREHQLTHER